MSLAPETSLSATQRQLLAELYKNVDFDQVPERFTVSVNDESELPDAQRRREMLLRTDLVDLMKSHVMAGDPICDAYACLVPQYGFQPLVQMFKDALDHGLDAVGDAPPELVTLIGAIEHVPDWVDLEMVEQGARADRNFLANVLPYIMQMMFIGTFMNKYSALPMALTGTLGHSSARDRVLNTATWAMITALPGTFDRYAPGFKVCAMVRLMHSMVRVHVLSKNIWDSTVYGVPIPHTDQMPAGTLMIYWMSKDVLKAGRTEFTAAERARVEHSRYRAYLLGLPEHLLPTTPQGIVDIFDARSATTRRTFDEKICGPLVRAALEVDLSTDSSLRSKLRQSLSVSLGKFVFIREFAAGDKQLARTVGVTLKPTDYPRGAFMAAIILMRTKSHELAAHIPVLRHRSDRHLLRKIEDMLVRYGHAEFVSDGEKYRPTTSAHT